MVRVANLRNATADRQDQLALILILGNPTLKPSSRRSLSGFSISAIPKQAWIASKEKALHYVQGFRGCRGGRIRTCGPLLPKQVR